MGGKQNGVVKEKERQLQLNLMGGKQNGGAHEGLIRRKKKVLCFH